MSTIKSILAREILDSRGKPTIETTLTTEEGWTTTTSIPSGASLGAGEAKELRDLDPNRYHGQGVLKAVGNVNDKLGPAVIGKDPVNQKELDEILINLDGTSDKSSLGANAILSVSQAVCKAGALVQGLPIYSWIARLIDFHPSVIPIPLFNVVNGGRHGPNNLDFQEFLLIPTSPPSFSHALQTSSEVFYQIREVLSSHQASTGLGDEGGYAPSLFTNLDAFEVIRQAIVDAKYTPGQNFFFGIDCAASYLLQDGRYRLRDKTESLDTNEMIGFYEEAIKRFPIHLIEDPLEENDWRAWKELTSRIGNQTTIVGDDLIVTHSDRLEKAYKEQAVNGTIIKPNQVGTITETLEVIKKAKEYKFKIVVAHRSGDTTDDFVADLAVGIGSDYVKFGAPAKGERVVKYNRLLAIESQLKTENI